MRGLQIQKIQKFDIGSDNFFLEKCTYIEITMNEIILYSMMI